MIATANDTLALTAAAVAVAIDLRQRRIPNILSASTGLAALALAATGVGSASLPQLCAGAAIGLVVLFPGFLAGATGAGDVKLMVAIGALVGPGVAFRIALCTLVSGGAIAAAVACRRGRFGTTLRGALRFAGSGAARHEVVTAGAAHRFAYAPAIAFGTIAGLAW